MAYEIRLTSRARKELASLPRAARTRVARRIDALANDPRPIGVVKMKGTTSYRIRVGVYRIIYDIYDQFLLVEVIRVDHRKDVYRGD